MKKLYTAFLLVLLAALLGVGIYSLADQDAAAPPQEKCEFVKPEFSVRALLERDVYSGARAVLFRHLSPAAKTLLTRTGRSINSTITPAPAKTACSS